MKRYSRQSTADIVFDIVNIIILLTIAIIVLYPLIYILSASFSDQTLVIKGKIWLLPKSFNIEAYKRVFSNNDIMIGYKNTIIYTVVGTVVNICMTIAAAYPLSRKRFVGRNIFMRFFVFTMFFNGGLIPTYLVIKELGLYNNFWVMIIPGAVSVFNMIIMRTFFQTTIPEELYEASYMDGCGNLMALYKIVLPLSAPIIAVMVMFYGVAHWNEYFNAMIYLKSRSKYPLQIILREILLQSQMDSMSDISESSIGKIMMEEGIKLASIVASSVPVLLLYPWLQRYFVKGVMIGAVKG